MKSPGILVLMPIATALAIAAWHPRTTSNLGKQANGHFIVSSGQEILPGTISFPGRPADFAINPERELVAVQTNREVFLVTPKGVLDRTQCALPQEVGAGYRGIVWTKDRRGVNWTPNGMRFVVSTDQGYLQEYLFEDWTVTPKEKIWLVPAEHPRQVWPGGMVLSKDGKKIYVAVADLNAVCEIDIASHKKVREFPVERIPFECQLTEDGQELVVSNWGGRTPGPGDRLGVTGAQKIVVNERGSASTGSVTIVQLDTGRSRNVEVGLHPNAIAIQGSHAYVANGSSDTISDINLKTERVVRTIPLLFKGVPVYGAIPNALGIKGSTLYCCDGGDNAVAEIELSSGKVKGYRPAGYFPIGIQFGHDGHTVYVLNSKGNGSVNNANIGVCNPHEFQGTITEFDSRTPLADQTRLVAKLNHWDGDNKSEAKQLAVYGGAIQHVLYIIKENQTYDSIFGDMRQGNGDPSLCVLGERVMPNHRKIARDFTLFDNGYVSGTNSADGHAWCTQAMANDYMEREYVGYRTYPDDGRCALALAPEGCIWDAASKAHKSIRVYGEYADADLATFTPREPKDWFEAWEDRKSGRHQFQYHANTMVPSLKPFLCTTMHYWPIIESDQARADTFIAEYERFSRQDKVPDLTILTLTNDHGAGMDPKFPTIASMGADNDLAYGRVVDKVTHSPQWKHTAIFMIEDDGQALPDHIDGHRTAFQVITPYNVRHATDHNLYTTVDMIKSIEMMLGFGPMNRFDWLARPITTCFTNTLDLAPYVHCPNNQPLDEHQPALDTLDATGRQMYLASKRLDWSFMDRADPSTLSRIYWYSLTGGRPYPEQFAVKSTAELEN